MKTSVLLMCLLLFTRAAYSQDSLYLVGTMIGKSASNNILDVDCIGDINNDGYIDFSTLERTGLNKANQTLIKIFFGSAKIDLIPDLIFYYPGKDSLNSLGRCRGIGDINNDGFSDFVIKGSYGDDGYPKGKIFIYYGGNDIDTIYQAEISESWIQDNFGYAIEAVGDINKDGFNDFAVTSTYNWSNGKGFCYLFFGGDTIDIKNNIIFSVGTDNRFGNTVANVGDTNGDNFDDIAISASADYESDRSKIFIFFGGNHMNIIPNDSLIGNSIFSLMDMNGDGKTDYAIKNDIVNLYISDKIPFSFSNSPIEIRSGDINGDKYNDLIFGDNVFINNSGSMVGNMLVYFGSSNFDTIADIEIEGENKWDEFGKKITTGDLNNDGCDEIIVFAPGFPNYEEPYGKIYIYSYRQLVGVEETPNEVTFFNLYQNYPNPFNPTTSIQYSVDNRQFIILKIYDLLGKEITTLVHEEKSAGIYTIEFDAAKYNLCSGIYFCELKTGGNKQRIKMLLLR